jgi:hypothetical protein
MKARILAWPLPGPKASSPPPFALLDGEDETPWNRSPMKASAAWVKGDRIYRLSIAEGNGPVPQVRIDSAVLRSQGPLAPVLSVAALRDAGIGKDSSLLLTMTGGGMHWVEWTSGGFGRQRGLKPAPADLVRFGGGAFAGSDGALYRLGPDTTAIAFADPFYFTHAADVLNRHGALWNRGTVQLDEGGVHSRYRVPEGPWNDFRQVRTREGLFVRLYGGQDTLQVFLRDHPTHIRSALLGSRLLPLPDAPSTAFTPGAMPETLTVAFGDTEGNFEAPLLERTRNGEFLRLVGEFVPVDPQAGCAQAGLCLKPKEPVAKVILGRESVTVIMPLRVGKLWRNMCDPDGYFTNQDTVVVRTHPWAHGDTLRFKAGLHEVRVHHEGASAIRNPAAPGGPRGMPRLDRKAGSRARTGPSVSRGVEVFDLVGRKSP